MSSDQLERAMFGLSHNPSGHPACSWDDKRDSHTTGFLP